VAKELRGRHVGDAVTAALLERADGAVHALALAPGFFARHGFAAIEPGALPASLQAKATGMCASTGFVAMRREKVGKGTRLAS
jgi:N-acetylglutamate synthase-like GNAT family acetyltransferase